MKRQYIAIGLLSLSILITGWLIPQNHNTYAAPVCKFYKKARAAVLTMSLQMYKAKCKNNKISNRLKKNMLRVTKKLITLLGSAIKDSPKQVQRELATKARSAAIVLKGKITKGYCDPINNALDELYVWIEAIFNECSPKKS